MAAIQLAFNLKKNDAMIKKTIAIVLFIGCVHAMFAQSFIVFNKQENTWNITDPKQNLSIYTDDTDDWLVQKSAALLQSDLEKVIGRNIALTHDLQHAQENLIIIGSIKGSTTINSLKESHQINVDAINSQWEAFQLQTVEKPFKNVSKAFIITGSDKRGTAYGVFEFSKQAGVSPWYWWADVPIEQHKNIFIKNGIHTFKSPTVQ